MSNKRKKGLRQLLPEPEFLFYLPLPIAMTISSSYAFMLMALPIIFLACYIATLTLHKDYQRALTLIPQFIFAIFIVYLLAALHPATDIFAFKLYLIIAGLAFGCWCYRFIIDLLAYRSKHD